MSGFIGGNSSGNASNIKVKAIIALSVNINTLPTYIPLPGAKVGDRVSHADYPGTADVTSNFEPFITVDDQIEATAIYDYTGLIGVIIFTLISS